MNYVYYFTGTGNSLQIANDIATQIENKTKGICNVRKITDYKGEKLEADTVGLIFPVYNWGLPLIVVNFLKKVNISNDTYVYAIANYGGLPGRALDQCKSILEKRNINLASGFLIQMPGNYIIAYDAKDQRKQEKIFKNEREKIKEISDIISQGKQMKIQKSHAMIDRLFTNYMYKDTKNFHCKDNDFVVNESCIGCGLCSKRCPVGNIIIKDKKPVWKHKCEFCLACIQSCPKEAIDYKEKTKGRKRYINPNVKL